MINVAKERQKQMNAVGRDYGVQERNQRLMVKAFEKADADESGTIEYDEFVKVFAIEPGPLSKSLWKYYDQDQSGAIDFKEFITRLAESLSIKSVAERTEWAFQIYDLDRDGQLTLREIEEALNDGNVGIKWDQGKLRSIFSDKAIDKGCVTKEEFCQKSKICGTLIYPAFVMLDAVKSKAFHRKTAVDEHMPDLTKDLKKARKDKQMKG